MRLAWRARPRRIEGARLPTRRPRETTDGCCPLAPHARQCDGRTLPVVGPNASATLMPIASARFCATRPLPRPGCTVATRVSLDRLFQLSAPPPRHEQTSRRCPHAILRPRPSCGRYRAPQLGACWSSCTLIGKQDPDCRGYCGVPWRTRTANSLLTSGRQPVSTGGDGFGLSVRFQRLDRSALIAVRCHPRAPSSLHR